MQFTANEDFYCEETQSHYCKGLSYTMRPASAYNLSGMGPNRAKAVKKRCDALTKLLPQWIKDGKVRPGGPEVASGVVVGKGDAS